MEPEENERQLVVIDEEPLIKPKKIQKKKKKGKKKKRTYESLIANPKVIQKIHDKIDQCENIPETLKRKYKEIEVDPLKLILTNIPFNVERAELIEYLNTYFNETDPTFKETDDKPIRNCFIGETRRFAILHIRDLDCVGRLLNINSIYYKDTKIYIERPKGFFTKHFAGNRFGMDEHGNLTNLDNSEDITLYLTNIPQYMKEDEIKKLVGSFGPLKDFKMKMEFSMGVSYSKGVCVFEYFNSLHAEEAYKNLQDMEIGQNKLKVQKIESNLRNERAAKNKTAATKEIQTAFLLMFSKIRDPIVQGMLNIPEYCVKPSKVVQLLNLCTIEDLFETEFYEQLKEDIENECKQFGAVEQVIIIRPDIETGECCPSTGKVFIKFFDTLSARKCQYRLNGRPYNFRTAVCSFYPEDKFDKADYLNRIN